MVSRTSAISTLFLSLVVISCGESPKQVPDKVGEKITKTDPSAPGDTLSQDMEKVVDSVEEPFRLTEANAIDFFFNYAKDLKEDRVKITTSMGSFTIELYDNVPYHKANFIFLAKQHYF